MVSEKSTSKGDRLEPNMFRDTMAMAGSAHIVPKKKVNVAHKNIEILRVQVQSQYLAIANDYCAWTY